MAVKNYTPIDDLVQKWKKSSVSLPKEAEPQKNTTETLSMQEAVEHEPDTEVAPFVKPKHETIKIPSDLANIGLQPAKSTSFPTYQNIKLPISDEKVIEGLKEPVSSSRRWLSEFALFILKQAHLTLRKVGGKVVRVIRLS